MTRAMYRSLMSDNLRWDALQLRDGDIITIKIPDRSINVEVSDEELAKRRAEQDKIGWKPAKRDRVVSNSLKVFALLAQSADKGAARRQLD